MKQTISAGFLLLLALISAQGCIFDDEKPENPDRGTYTLALSDSTMATYPGGGDVIILEMTPSEDFEGSVRLSVKGDTGLNVKMNQSSVTSEKRITEIIIHPDSLLANGKYVFNLKHIHGGKTHDTDMEIDISNLIKPHLNDQYLDAVDILNNFINWGKSNRSEFIKVDIHHFTIHAISNMGIGGSGTWVAVSSEWEMHFWWTAGGPRIISWFLIRRMGEKEPSYCFLTNNNGGFDEKKTSEYIGRYSHVW